MRLPERRGIVTARLAGARVARAPVLCVLDSHVEVNYQWLEPQLEALKESPKAFVFPQIPAIDPKTFEIDKYGGIG